MLFGLRNGSYHLRRSVGVHDTTVTGKPGAPVLPRLLRQEPALSEVEGNLLLKFFHEVWPRLLSDCGGRAAPPPLRAVFHPARRRLHNRALIETAGDVP